MRTKLVKLPPLAATLAALWIAAPALSASPWLPEAEDFSQALPPLERLGAAPAAARVAAGHAGEVAFRSPVIAAPERFDLAGLAGELRPLELRARERGGEWSRWVETANGDPVYFGGAEELQLRARGWRPAGTLHYVNVSGTTGTLDSLLSGARRAVNGAFVSLAGALEPAAQAELAKPEMVSRSAWGANREEGGCRPRETPDRGVVKGAVIHHTVTAERYSEAEAPAIVLGICRYHRNGNGWNDIGYNALADRFGNLYVGRAGGIGRAVVGAHAEGYNAQTFGVAALGTHTERPISAASMDAFVELLAWKLERHGVRPRGRATLVSAGGSSNRYPSGRRVTVKRISGHGTLNHTSCPGAALAAELRRIRRRTQERVDEGGGIGEPPPDGGVGGGIGSR